MNRCISNCTTKPGREPGRSPSPEPGHSESELGDSESRPGRGSPSRPEPGRSASRLEPGSSEPGSSEPGSSEPGSSEAGSSLVPRWLEAYFETLFGCETEEQAWDIDNDRYPCEHVLNLPITITSALKRRSDYRHGFFAQVGFQTADGSRGQFSIGRNAAWFPLQQQRFGKLPVTAILRVETTRRGRLYRWEHL